MSESKITTLEALKLAVEDAAEAKIFEHVWLASEAAKQEAFANNLSIVVLEGNQLVEIAPNGAKKVLKTLELKPVDIHKLFLKPE
jgi:hypothetical protein